MFDHPLLDSGVPSDTATPGNRRLVSLAVAVSFELVLLGILILIPLTHTEALPKMLTNLVLPLAPPPPGPAHRAAPAVNNTRHSTMIDLMKAPIVVPKTIAQIREEPAAPPEAPAPGVIGNGPSGIQGGGPNGVWKSFGDGTLPPPPPPTSSNATKMIRIRPGGRVEPPRLIFQPKPEYPALAKMARIQGTVQLEAVISTGGTIQALKAVSGHPLLVNAAVESVSRWRYQPTLLNGEPVAVIMEVRVIFHLGD